LYQAVSAKVTFVVDKSKPCEMIFDLRFRQAHASSGRFPEPGTAGNLPSGETYIVPYEGELDETSKTAGTLPVQFFDQIVFYDIVNNRAHRVYGDDPKAKEEAELLAVEPAYGNIGEFAFGILADFGLEPIGEILLDEKLGFHVAFGRSDHFGGAVGPEDFSSPDKVVHIDRVYIPETQPRVIVERVDLEYKDNRFERIMEHGRYLNI
jgi:leucyl aminopeptidase (aminopeptidase T)